MANYLGKFRSQLVPVSLPEGDCDGIASDFQMASERHGAVIQRWFDQGVRLRT